MSVKKRSFIMALVLICVLSLLPFQVFAAEKSITLNTTELKLTVGESKTLTATVTGPGKKIKWKSSKKAVATVNKNGKVTAKKAGKTKITAKVNGKTASCLVTVEKVKYKELYRAFLENSTVKAGKDTITPRYFYMLNIDRKNVPELVVVESDNSICTYYVYTVKKGKVKYLGSATGDNDDIEPAIRYIKKYKGIYVNGWIHGGGEWKNIYSISGSKFKMTRGTYCYPLDFASEEMEYTIGPKGKIVSKAAFDKYCKKNMKYVNSYKTFKMYYNSAANRDKYL